MNFPVRKTLVSTALAISLSAGLADLVWARSPTQIQIKAKFVVAKDTEELGFKWVTRIDREVTPRECWANRRVTIFHDENADGKLGPYEFIIKKGRTNERGKFARTTDIWPPEGDTAGIRVKKTAQCRKAKASTVIPAPPG